jgi:hypothetical protein
MYILQKWIHFHLFILVYISISSNIVTIHMNGIRNVPKILILGDDVGYTLKLLDNHMYYSVESNHSRFVVYYPSDNTESSSLSFKKHPHEYIMLYIGDGKLERKQWAPFFRNVMVVLYYLPNKELLPNDGNDIEIYASEQIRRLDALLHGERFDDCVFHILVPTDVPPVISKYLKPFEDYSSSQRHIIIHHYNNSCKLERIISTTIERLLCVVWNLDQEKKLPQSLWKLEEDEDDFIQIVDEPIAINTRSTNWSSSTSSDSTTPCDENINSDVTQTVSIKDSLFTPLNNAFRSLFRLSPRSQSSTTTIKQHVSLPSIDKTIPNNSSHDSKRKSKSSSDLYESTFIIRNEISFLKEYQSNLDGTLINKKSRKLYCSVTLDSPCSATCSSSFPSTGSSPTGSSSFVADSFFGFFPNAVSFPFVKTSL